jgi:hypothetical protein
MSVFEPWVNPVAETAWYEKLSGEAKAAVY